MSLNISIEALEVVDTIARKGSFAAAAAALYKVPSALTYTVKKLEEDLGVIIFDRSGHRSTLTEAGAELLNAGRQLLDAAQALESRVKRVATGVETEINIAINDLFTDRAIFRVLETFYAQAFGTRVKLSREVFGGSWDALTTGRADISIGAPGDAPAGGGYAIHLLGQIEFVFAVASHHPLAQSAEPLHRIDIIRYRAVAAADSSRNLAPRTSGILSGQDVLTVPDMQTKLAAQRMGLGVGYLPMHLAKRYVDTGDLVVKNVMEAKPITPAFIAWRQQRTTEVGKAQQWLLKHLKEMTLDDFLM